MNYVLEDETLDDLELKNIYVIQKKNGFRFGVDGVLLANFAKVKKGMKVCDLCSGTGIVPFVIAGKREASKIVGVEIQEELVDMAKRSVLYNHLEEKVDFVLGDLKSQELIESLGTFNVVTVNPPYKLCDSGLVSEKYNSAISRHEILCNLEDVIIASKKLLKDNGRLYMVHRPDRVCDALCLMRKHRLEPKSIRTVHPSKSKAPNIVLIEAQKFGGAYFKWEDPLYIHEEDGSYTKELEEIYGRDKR